MPASRITAFAAALFLLAALTTARATPERYELDSAHLTVAFLVDHIGYAKTLGHFREASGSFHYDEATRTLSKVRVEVRTDSVDTNHSRRDKHLRGKDFFDVRKHPDMVFTADSAKAGPDGSYVIEGQLELLGKALPLTLNATRNRIANYPFGSKDKVMGVSARGTVTRSEYGMNYAVENGWVGNDIELIIEFEAIQK